MDIGARIKEIRVSKGITQTHLLKSLKKSSGWLSQIENGDRIIKAEDLALIADLLETPIEQFFLPINLTKSKISQNQPA